MRKVSKYANINQAQEYSRFDSLKSTLANAPGKQLQAHKSDGKCPDIEPKSKTRSLSRSRNSQTILAPCAHCAVCAALHDLGLRLLAEMDALHGTRSGTTMRKLCERAFRVYGGARFERLAGISNEHLYNLRQHKAYQAKRGSFDRTRPARKRRGRQGYFVPNILKSFPGIAVNHFVRCFSCRHGMF